MRTTSILNRILWWLVSGCASSMALVAAVGASDSALLVPYSRLDPVLGPGGRWSLRITTVDASGVERAINPVLDHPLRGRIRPVREVKEVGNGFSDGGRVYYVLATSTDSKTEDSHGAGYCGAGTEQSLWILELTARRDVLKFVDSLLVQSCLKSLALVGDSDLKLKEWSATIADPRSFELQWLDHPNFGGTRRHVLVQGGRWLIR